MTFSLTRKSLIALIVSGSFNFCSFAQNAVKPTVSANKMDWWREARFGMFIHWGVYAVPAGVYDGKNIDGLGEWIMQDAKIPVNVYAQYAKKFNPTKYNAEQWVLMAKNAGMKYIVITSKHHDGFALFDSKASNWNVVKATPYGKDILKQLVDACRKYNMKLGFYYSQANDWSNAGGAAAFGHWDKTQDSRTMDQYLDSVAIPQVKEILTQYGDVVELWWDVPTDMTKARAEKLNALLSLQPGIITNDRLGGGFLGDITTPEQYIPATGIAGRDWETCMTMNDTWGFKTNDGNWKSSEELIRNLIDIASKGGNYLLNVGPDATGEFPEPIVARLKNIGAWMDINHEAIYGTTASPFKVLPWAGRCTKKVTSSSTTLYLHVFSNPGTREILLPGLKNKISSVKWLANGNALEAKNTSEGVVISLLNELPNAVASVIKVEVKGALQIEPYMINSAADGSFTLKAETADIHNKQGETSALVEGDWSSRNIGYWTSSAASVSWTIQVAKPGTYTCVLTAATPAQQSKFSIAAADQKIDDTITNTGGYNSYKEFTTGKIIISKAGTYTVTVQPDPKEWQAINLRQLKLVP